MNLLAVNLQMSSYMKKYQTIDVTNNNIFVFEIHKNEH